MAKRRRNRVESLSDSNGLRYEGNGEMLSLATNYFSKLFTSNGIRNPDSILKGIAPCIFDSMNEELGQDFTYEDVCLALKSMNHLKESREDGLGAIFY